MVCVLIWFVSSFFQKKKKKIDLITLVRLRVRRGLLPFDFAFDTPPPPPPAPVLSLPRQTDTGATALHRASAKNQTEIVRFLLARGGIWWRQEWGGWCVVCERGGQKAGVSLVLALAYPSQMFTCAWQPTPTWSTDGTMRRSTRRPLTATSRSFAPWWRPVRWLRC